MKIIDLTHDILPGMPMYPGTEGPLFTVAATCVHQGYRETKVSLLSHTGTHMDGPAHVFENGKTLDQFEVAGFVGKGAVVDCRGCERITMTQITDPASEADFLLFHTGWSRKWGEAAYFEAYPCISEEVASYIVSSGKMGIGLDTPSPDPVHLAGLPVHKKLLAAERVVIVENLCNLEQLPRQNFLFCALPLKIEAADGAPVRAIALY